MASTEAKCQLVDQHALTAKRVATVQALHSQNVLQQRKLTDAEQQ